MIPRSPEPERGFVLAVLGQGADVADELAEVEELARTAGVEPVGEIVQHRARPAQRTYVGKGKLEELKQRFKESEAESLLVDDELDPAQQRFLENALDTRVIDRTQLILDIFAQHADERRGQAPGRARAARVQPAAHARHVAAPRAPRRRRRHARPGRVAARDRPPAGAAPHHRAEAEAEGSREAARDAAQGAAAHRDADDRARRLHERRQVDAPERADRLGGLRREPALRDARPDDARLRARRAPLPRHRHRRLHPPPAASTRRGLRVDARGDARRRHGAARRRRLCARRGAGPAAGGGRRRAARDRSGRAADRGRAEQDRPRRPARPPAPREPLPGRAAGLGAHRRGDGGSPGRAGPALRRSLGARAPARAVRGAAAGCRSCTRSARRSRSARTPRTACWSSPACRAATCRASRRSSSPTRPSRTGRSPDRAADPDGCAPNAVVPARAYAGDAGLDLSSCERVELAPGERALVPTGLAVAIPEGYAGYVQPRSGLAAKHGISIVNTPGPRRLRLPRRAARQPPQHRPRRDVRRRAGDAHRPARDPRAARRSSSSRSTSCPSSERGVRGFGSSLH